jgi:hypothetical protein
MREQTSKIDMDVLDQIIALAENAMIEPFKKKKEGEETPPIEGEDETEFEMVEDKSEDFGDDDISALMEEYKRMKGR